MIEILTSLQLLNGCGLLIVMGLVIWLVVQQRKQRSCERQNAGGMESFTHELSLTADAIIDRYEQQRLRLEDTARRIERLLAAVAATESAPAPVVTRGSRRQKTKAMEPERQIAVAVTHTSVDDRPGATSGELELIRKMQSLRGGDTR